MNIRPNIKTGISVCPHDCPSACALEVELLDAHTIGRVRGSMRNIAVTIESRRCVWVGLLAFGP